MLIDMIQVRNYHCVGPQRNFGHSEQVHNTNIIITSDTASFEFEIGDIGGIASFGDLIFCPPDVKFKRNALSEISFHCITFDTSSERSEASVRLPIGKISITDTSRLASTLTYLRKLHTNLTLPSVPLVLLRNQLIYDILLMCDMELLFKENYKKNADPLMLQAISYIHQHAFKNDVTMHKLAEQLGINQSQLTRRFHSVCGLTPLNYLTKMRLDKVKRLLLETNDTLESIADQCGYENGSYLCRVFSTKIGTTPSLYRQNYRI